MIPTVGFNMRKITKGNVTIKVRLLLLLVRALGMKAEGEDWWLFCWSSQNRSMAELRVESPFKVESSQECHVHHETVSPSATSRCFVNISSDSTTWK